MLGLTPRSHNARNIWHHQCGSHIPALEAAALALAGRQQWDQNLSLLVKTHFDWRHSEWKSPSQFLQEATWLLDPEHEGVLPSLTMFHPVMVPMSQQQQLNYCILQLKIQCCSSVSVKKMVCWEVWQEPEVFSQKLNMIKKIHICSFMKTLYL